MDRIYGSRRRQTRCSRCPHTRGRSGVRAFSVHPANRGHRPSNLVAGRARARSRPRARYPPASNRRRRRSDERVVRDFGPARRSRRRVLQRMRHRHRSPCRHPEPRATPWARDPERPTLWASARSGPRAARVKTARPLSQRPTSRTPSTSVRTRPAGRARRSREDRSTSATDAILRPERRARSRIEEQAGMSKLALPARPALRPPDSSREHPLRKRAQHARLGTAR